MKNTGRETLEIGDLALPLPMNTDYVWDHEETFVRRVFRHAFIAGHGSFLYWLPVKGSGSFLVMMPEGDTAPGVLHRGGHGLRLRQGAVHACSSTRRPAPNWSRAAPGASRAPAACCSRAKTSPTASPSAGPTPTTACARCCCRNGGVDVQVAPGMVVPRDLEAQVALRTQQKIERVEAEFPERHQGRIPRRSAARTRISIG